MGRRSAGLLAAVVLVATTAGLAPSVSAVDDPEAAREAARQRQAQVSNELDTLTATEAELEQALEELAGQISDQKEALASARRAVEAAERRLDEAKAAVAATVEAIDELTELVVERAITEFVAPPSFDIEAFARVNDLNQASRLSSMLGAVADSDEEAVELLRAAEKRLARQEAEASRAAAAAVDQREATAAQLEELEATEAKQVEVRKALEVRIAEFKREADALAAEEEELTRIIEERAAEQRRLAAERAAAEAEQRAAAERAAQAAASAGGGAAPAPPPAPAAPPASNGRLGWPAAGRVSSEFGHRWGRLHAGIDIAAVTGTSIHAAEGGTVFYTGWRGGYGNTVLIDHGGGLTTLYAHQSRIAVRNGTRVERGQLIGYVGNTGNSTGPHLHFETRVNGAPQNPRNHL